jgi:hypothetical protein
MDVATFVIAVLGLVVATGIAVWQGATFILSNGRARVTVFVGASNGDATIQAAADKETPEQILSFSARGYRDPFIGVKVENYGRAPIFVDRWGLRHDSGLKVFPLHATGPDLPYRIEAGANESWRMDLQPAIDVEDATDKTYSAGALRGSVELGDGRVVESRKTFRLTTGDTTAAATDPDRLSTHDGRSMR